jgi:hypothetical protein
MVEKEFSSLEIGEMAIEVHDRTSPSKISSPGVPKDNELSSRKTFRRSARHMN